MNKKNNINKWGVIFGLFLMYIWTYIFLVNTTDNNSNKDYTYISKALAWLQFFQDQNKKTNYNQTNSTLYNWKWASPNFPKQAIYGSGVIIKTPNIVPIVVGITNWTLPPTIVYIPRPIPPRRHSH